MLPVQVDNSLIVLAKVAGLNKAKYGTSNVEIHPLWFEKDNRLVATTKLSNFATGHHGTKDSGQEIWTYNFILND